VKVHYTRLTSSGVVGQSYEIDFELGYGGRSAMKGACMLIMHAKLGGAYNDWKKTVIQRESCFRDNKLVSWRPKQLPHSETTSM
jgi:hypothetical protein